VCREKTPRASRHGRRIFSRLACAGSATVQRGKAGSQPHRSCPRRQVRQSWRSTRASSALRKSHTPALQEGRRLGARPQSGFERERRSLFCRRDKEPPAWRLVTAAQSAGKGRGSGRDLPRVICLGKKKKTFKCERAKGKLLHSYHGCAEGRLTNPL